MILQFLPQLLTLVLCVFSRKNIHPPPPMKYQLGRWGGWEGRVGGWSGAKSGGARRLSASRPSAGRLSHSGQFSGKILPLGCAGAPISFPLSSPNLHTRGPASGASRHCTPPGAKATCPPGRALARPPLAPSAPGLFLPWSRGCVLSPSRRSRCASHSHLALPGLRAASAFVPQERR